MTIPDYQTVMLPLLKIAAQGETSVLAAEGLLADTFALSDQERAELLPSGKQRIFHNRVHWAKFYLQKAGLLESPKRGRFAITAAGEAVLSNPPPGIDVAYLKQFPAFVTFYAGEPGLSSDPAPQASEEAAASTPEELVESVQRSLETELRGELLGRILEGSPGFFEGLIVDLLLAMGYGGSRREAAQQLGKSGDGGVDGVINEDALGLDRIYVQAKRYQPATAVGRPEVQAFVGSLVGMGASKGVFVTTSHFSAQASAYVERVPQSVVLIDGVRLTQLMILHKVGVRVSRTLEFKRLDEDFFSEDL